MIVVLLVLTILILVVFHSWIRLIKDSSKLNISGPFPFPIVGNGHLFFGDSTKHLNVFTRLAKEYNDVYRLYIQSHRYVVLSHPKYIEPILSSSVLTNKSRAYSFFRPWLGESLLTSSGHTWKKQHKFLAPAFTSSVLPTFLPVFLKNAKILKAKLTSLADGSPLNMPSIFNALTFDNITESVLGISFDTLKHSESEYLTAVKDISRAIASRIRNPLLANDIVFSLSHLKVKMDKALEIIHRYSNDIIRSRREVLMEANITTTSNNLELGTKNKAPFLDLLLLADFEGRKLEDEAVSDQLNTIMFAGHDTVASAIIFILYCISKHKEVQNKILAEQKEIFNEDMERDLNYNELQQMKYLELVIKESMRLYPAVPLIERLIKEDVDVAGLYLPKDTLVFINIFDLHRNPKVYTNPLEFRPERFEGNLGSDLKWIPFSAGPRICIGQKLAMMEMKVIVSAMIKNFELLPSGAEPEVYSDVVLKSKNGPFINLFRRF